MNETEIDNKNLNNGKIPPQPASVATNKIKKLGSKISDIWPYLVVGLLVFLLVFTFLWNRIVIIIKAGEAGAFYSLLFGGSVTDYVYPEGIYLIFPWDTMTVYDARVQILKHEFDVLTSKGLPLHVKIAVRFRPQYDLIGLLHQQVGPDYVEKIIIPQIESVLRKNMGQYDPEDIYTNKQGILSRTIVLALEEIGRKYVQVDELIIRSLELPESVRKAIEQKLVNEQQYKAYEYKLATEQEEAKRKHIEAKGIADYQEIVAQTLNEPLLKWQGIHATQELATSSNAKTVVIGAGQNGLPIILNDK